MRIIFTIAYIKYNLIYAARNLTVKLLRRRALFLWRQGDTSSLCLFSVDSSGRQMIRNFPQRQRLHLLLELLYGECDGRMRQEIKCSMLLKSFSVSPMYVSVVLLSLRVTVAW